MEASKTSGILTKGTENKIESIVSQPHKNLVMPISQKENAILVFASKEGHSRFGEGQRKRRW